MSGTVRLTDLAHGGGCGCKLSPAVLRDLLKDMPAMLPFPDLLVGTETSDDAAVYRISQDQAVVATTDFFMPIVDDPFDFGRIAAANALSDVYAMGGTPIMALALLGIPVGVVAPETARQILAGGASICALAGIPVAGGHSIDSPEPIYGLVAIGMVPTRRILRNNGAKPGDALILTKGLGVGVICAALKSRRLSDGAGSELYGRMISSTTQINAVGSKLADFGGVHAVTDVTGFGLLGHALEMCRGAGLAAHVRRNALPIIEGAADLARASYRTGAAVRNWASYGEGVSLAPHIAEWECDLLCDPQTSGGLLIAVSKDQAQDVLALLHREGFSLAAIIGQVVAGEPIIYVD